MMKDSAGIYAAMSLVTGFAFRPMPRDEPFYAFSSRAPRAQPKGQTGKRAKAKAARKARKRNRHK